MKIHRLATIRHNWSVHYHIPGREYFSNRPGGPDEANAGIKTMFRTSTYTAMQAPREVAVDEQVHPEDGEYQHVSECVQQTAGQTARIQKVLRHQIPGSLYNGGKCCRVSWSVLAEADGHTMHYTVYNQERTPLSIPVGNFDDHGFYVRAAREVPGHAH